MKKTLPITLKHFLFAILVFCTTAAALSQNNSPITGFVLVNADTGEDLVSLTDGIQLDQCEFASLSLSIRALIDPNRQNEVQSVFLAIDGPNSTSYGRTENMAPYALFGDLNSMFNGELFFPGEYALKAVPYSEANAGGEEGERLNINISFAIDLPAVSSQFELMDATTNTVISSLSDGAIIDNAITTTTNVSLRAIVNADCHPNIASVFLKLEGPVNYGRTENLEAYALFGDVDGDFTGRDLPAGSYTFSVIPYTEDNAGGIRGETVVYNFEITEKDTTGLTFVPDDNFEQWFIDNGYDDTLDNYVVTNNLETVKEILYIEEVNDFTGIEACKELEALRFNNCNLTNGFELNNDKLTQIVIGESTIKGDLKLGSLVNLNSFSISFVDQLESIDFGLNTSLNVVHITSVDDLTNLNVKQCPDLKTLIVFGVLKLQFVDVSRNTDLDFLEFVGDLIAIDISQNMELSSLILSGNSNLECVQVTDVNKAINNEKWEIDNPNVYSLNCFTEGFDVFTSVPDDNLEQWFISNGFDDELDNQVLTANLRTVTSIDLSGVSDFTGIGACQNLISFTGSNCTFRENGEDLFLISQISALESFDCDSCNTGELLDFNLENPNLKHLRLVNHISNGIKLNNTKLEKITLSGSFKGNLDLKSNGLAELKILDLSSSDFQSIDVSKNGKLTSIKCNNCDAVQRINLKNNNNDLITNLQLKNAPALNCIQVDNVSLAVNNQNWEVDELALYSETCFTSGNGNVGSITEFLIATTFADTGNPRLEAFDMRDFYNISKKGDLLFKRPSSIISNVTGKVGSVEFEFKYEGVTQSETSFRTDNDAPFSLFGESGQGAFILEPFVDGRYTLIATPYSEVNLTGTKGTPVSIEFILSRYSTTLSPLMEVLDAEKDVRTALIGACCGFSNFELTPSNSNRQNLSIGALEWPDEDGTPISVTFHLEGPINHTFTDNEVPFSLFGDTNGDYNGTEFLPGEYTITYTGVFANEPDWRPSDTRSIDFIVFDDASGKKIVTITAKPILYPNPSKEHITVDIGNGTPLNGIRIVNIYGKQLKKVAAKKGSNPIDVSALSPGVYFILTETDLGTSSQKLIIQ